jgi:hypothetical protein
MQNLTVGDLSLGLANLATVRKPHVDGCASGLLYGPILAEKQSAIETLPEALRGGRPLAEALGHTDHEHDALGGALWNYTGAILGAPTSTPHQRAAAQRIRDAFIPSKATLADSYAEEAAAAKKNRAKLVERKADLELFPLPDGKSLYDWASAFLDRGDALDDLLNQRSMADVGQSHRKMAARLRSETIGLLFQFRSTLRAEIAHKKLSADLEGYIFSYFDELSERRPSKKAKPTETPAPAPEPEPNG